MNTLLLTVVISLIILQMLGIRTMHKDHLFAIAHRAEMGIWVVFAAYLSSIEFPTADTLLVGVQELKMPLMLQLILLSLMVARIFSCVAFTIGNPPKVRIDVYPQDESMHLSAVTSTPGVEVDAQGHGNVLL